MKPQQKSRGADNKSEYLIIYLQGCNKLAMLLDANLERIAEYNADAQEVGELLDLAKELGPVDGDNWGKLACRLSPVQRATATAYRLHI